MADETSTQTELPNTLSLTDAPTRCRHLRSKNIYMDLPFHPSGMESSGTPCWCFRTQQVFGPDGETASERKCNPDRLCYEKDAF
jgi:hypothetical protein